MQSEENEEGLIGFRKTVKGNNEILNSQSKNPLRRYSYYKSSVVNNSALDKKLKTIITDDSGYMSQNLESNSSSSADTAMDKHQSFLPSHEVKNLYLNEDTLLEKPPTTRTEMKEELHEYDHLYFMSSISDTPLLNSTLTSTSTTFSGFDADDSKSDISGTIPIASPILVSTSFLENISNTEGRPKSNSESAFKSTLNNSGVFNSDTSTSETLDKSLSLEEKVKNSNSIHTRMMDANNYNMSLFESFYTFVCDLYTRNDATKEDPSTMSINPNSLQIKVQQSPCKAYLQLETKQESLLSRQNELEVENVDKKLPEVIEKPPLSPDLFSDEEPPPPPVFKRQSPNEQKYIDKNDGILLKRTRECLVGVLPPPSITILQISAAEMLDKIQSNQNLFVSSADLNSNENCTENSKVRRSLLVNCRKEDCEEYIWPDVLHSRYHGLHYNRGKVSEDFEHLSVKYSQRYIGAETQSSCTVFGTNTTSPNKRKYKLKRPLKSPGKRLSHLARRRITFNKDSLYSGLGPSSCAFIGARTRQIMIDAKKLDLPSRRKSPKKKTPRKSPRRKTQTPTSSSKKRLNRSRFTNPEESLESTLSSCSNTSLAKRNSFQSPDKGECTNGLLELFGSDVSNSSQSSKRRTPRRQLFSSPLKNSPSKIGISSLYPIKRKMTPKRALFMSPDKNSSSSLKETLDKKRKRSESDEKQPNKLLKMNPSVLKESSTESKAKPVIKFGYSSEIAEHRKKKLMWSVAEALRSQKIDLKHPQFKVYASVLARLIRHFLPNLFGDGPKPEGSTTESMLRIARLYVFQVTRGKTVDEIIREAKKKARVAKPSGYVAPEGCAASNKDVSRARDKEKILQDRVNLISSTSTSVKRENIDRIRRIINFDDVDDGGGVR